MEEKDFKNWLTDFIEESQINQNNTFSFKNKDGSSRKISVEQILDYINNTDNEDAKLKFKESLEKGKEANNVMGYMYNASKNFPLKEKIEDNKNIEDNTSWFKRNEQMKELTSKSFEQLEARLKDPKTAQNALNAYNEYISQFKDLYNYSARNNELIFAQMKNQGLQYSGIVKSAKDWNELNVEVKGNPLMIIVPKQVPLWETETITSEDGKETAIYKLDEDGKRIRQKDSDGKPKSITYFNLSGKVYDVSQTNAFEKGYEKAMYKNIDNLKSIKYDEKKLKLIANEISDEIGVNITFKPLNGAELGYYTYQGGEHKIFIDNSIPIKNQLATLFHEVGHRIIHNIETNNRVYENKETPQVKGKKEAEAESFAYVIGQQFGIDMPSGEYILPYLQKADIKLKDVFEDVFKAVKTFNEKVNVEPMLTSFIKYDNNIDNMKTLMDEYKSIDNSAIDDIKQEVEQKNVQKDTQNNNQKSQNKNRQKMKG